MGKLEQGKVKYQKPIETFAVQIYVKLKKRSSFVFANLSGKQNKESHIFMTYIKVTAKPSPKAYIKGKIKT